MRGEVNHIQVAVCWSCGQTLRAWMLHLQLGSIIVMPTVRLMMIVNLILRLSYIPQ